MITYLLVSIVVTKFNTQVSLQARRRLVPAVVGFDEDALPPSPEEVKQLFFIFAEFIGASLSF